MVKRYVAGMVVNPYTISPDGDAGRRPAPDGGSTRSPASRWWRPASKGKLLGILTNRDVRFATNTRTPVSELMTKKLVTVRKA